MTTNKKRIDSVITVERRSAYLSGWLHKYVIIETGKVFYEQSDNIEEAYNNYCTQVNQLKFEGITIERGGQVRSKLAGQPWLYIYYFNGNKIIASNSNNMHKVYLSYMQKTNPLYGLPEHIRRTLCCSTVDGN